uniref:IPT/TIG domain-containing protein n=1 Tax=Bicosoecida sp. CB-2014 TaxID=1486930 RepID=A0A7S1GCG6_9STRA
MSLPLAYASAVVTLVHTHVPGHTDAFATTGGDGVTIVGRGFGPVAENAVDWVTYTSVRTAVGDALAKIVYGAVDCAVVVDDVEIACVAAPGIGSLLAWTVSIANQTSASTVTSYAPPEITSVALVDGGRVLDTSGGQFVELVGSNLGPAGAAALLDAVTYQAQSSRAAYTASECEVVEAHVRVRCRTAPGTGAGLVFRLSVGAQPSNEFGGNDTTSLSYAPPVITAVSAASLPTAGATPVVFGGKHFGASLSDVDVLYVVGNMPSHVDTFPSDADAERVGGLDFSDDDEVTFLSPEEEGYALWFVLSAAGQSAPPVRIAIDPPAIGDDGFQIDNPDTAIDNGATLEAHLRVRGTSFGFGRDVRVDVALLDGSSVNCPVLTDEATGEPMASHAYVVCLITVRAGSLTVTVGGRASAAVNFDFDLVLARPQLDSVAPVNGGTVGGTLVRIAGQNFLDPTVLVQQYSSAAGAPLRPAVACRVVSSTSSQVTVAMPPGAGSFWRFSVTSRNVRSFPSGAYFTYNAPVLTEVQPAAGRTVAGEPLVLRGRDFGPPEFEGVVTIDGQPCVVTFWNHSRVNCDAPAGLAAAQTVVVVAFGQPSWPTTAAGGRGAGAFGRLAPRVDAMTPRVGDSAGGMELVIEGRYFGEPGATVTVGGNVCVVREATDTSVTCTVPQGKGVGAAVVVDTGAQRTGGTLVSGAPLTFSYNPPAVTVVDVRASAAPASGGFPVLVRGLSLTTTPQVTIGNLSCEVNAQSSLAVDHRALECVAPPRAGGGVVRLVVTAGGQASDEVPFAYDAPVLRDVVPNTLDAEATTVVRIRGGNFGVILPDAGAFRVVLRDNVTCSDVAWISDAEIRCTITGPVASGAGDLSVFYWGVRATRPDRSDLSLVFECPRGTWGVAGQVCQPCPPGAECAGGASMPAALAGYYKLADNAFVSCLPASACPGGAGPACAPEYTGEACGRCQTSPRHYRLDQECLPCPNLAWLMLVGFFFVLVLLGAGGMYLNKRKVNLAAITIGIDFVQVLSVFSGYDFAWPVEIRSVFTTMSAANLNLELVAPECSVNWTFEQKWMVVQSVPLMCVTVVVLGLTARWVGKLAHGVVRGRRSVDMTGGVMGAAGPDETVDSAIGLVFTGLYYCYFVVVKYAMAVFDCSDNDEGKNALESDPSILCDEPGGVHERLVPLAALSLLVYGAGIPLLIAANLWVHRVAITADQALRAKGEGDSFLTNPNYAVRLRYRKLYEDFRAGVAGWRLVLIARKLLFAITTIMFNSAPLLQACISISVLFAAYVAHTHFKPFLPRATVSSSFLDVGRNVTVDVVPSASKRLAPRAGRPSRTGPGGPPGRRAPRQSVVAASLQAARKSAVFVFDYNQLESSFLSCAMTVLLCGTMFSSAEFSPGSVPHVLLTIVVAGVVGVSLLAFAGILGFEIWRAVKFAAVLAKARVYELERLQSLRRALSRGMSRLNITSPKARRRANTDDFRRASLAFKASPGEAGGGSRGGGGGGDGGGGGVDGGRIPRSSRPSGRRSGSRGSRGSAARPLPQVTEVEMVETTTNPLRAVAEARIGSDSTDSD